MRSVSLQQQVVLAVQLRPRDQSPCLVVQRPTQSMFPSWKQKNRVVAHRHQDAHVPKYTEQSANCLSRGTVTPIFHTVVSEIVMESC